MEHFSQNGGFELEICRKLMKKKRGKKRGETKKLEPQVPLTLKSVVFDNKLDIIKKTCTAKGARTLIAAKVHYY